MHTTQIKLQRHRTPYYILALILGVGFLFGVFSFLHVFTIATPEASAMNTSDSSTAYMAVNLDPAIEVWTTSYENNACTVTAISRVDIAAAPDETVYTGDICTHVSTNAHKGYTLTMSTQTADPTLTHEDSEISSVISPITGSGTSASVWQASSALNNMWGYDADRADSYKPVAGNTGTTTISTTTTPSTNDIVDLTFASKVDTQLPSGAYGNTIIFSAVANPDTDSYMQNFTPTACNQFSPWGYDATTGTVIRGSTKYLWDKRDGQAYAVRKLADGNCWMVENFNLSAESLTDNSHSTTLDYTDTDLTQGTTFTVPATSNTNWGGDSYPVEPKIATSNVPDYTDYGMYYNWWAATARTTNVTTGGTNVSGSICPKGWHLPTGAVNGTNSELRAVIAAHQAAYGFTNLHGSGNDMSKINRTNLLENDTVGPNLQFSGYWDYSAVVPVGQSSGGSWWSSTVNSEPYAYYTAISSNGLVYAGSVINAKRYGFSVRCVFTPTS